MQVFKAFMKIVKSNRVGVILYFGICVLMTIMVASQYGGNKGTRGYTNTSTSIIVNDNDESELSKAVVEYLKSQHDVDMAEYDEDKVKDLIFSAYYTAYIDIPKGFMERHLDNDPLEINAVFDTSLPDGNYVSLQLGSYVDGIVRFENAGFSLSEAIINTQKAVEPDSFIDLKASSKVEGSTHSKTFSLFLFLPYGIMSIILWCLLPAVSRFNVKDVKDRTMVSSISANERNIALFTGSILVSSVVYVGMSVFVSIFLKGNIFSMKWLLSMMNLLIFTLVTVGMVVLISSFSATSILKSKDIIINIISLGFSFLGGIFVPLEVLGDEVKTVSRFLPTYWYALGLEIIEKGAVFNDILGCFGMEALFGVVCVTAGLAISRVTLYIKER